MLTKAILTFATMATLALSAPMAASSVELNIRSSTDPGVYSCSGPNWTGECVWESAENRSCHNYSFGGSSSFGPDHGLACKLFAAPDCDPAVSAGGIRFPGFAHVGGLPLIQAEPFGGQFLSWSCEPSQD